MKIRRERVSAAPAQACSPQRSSRVDRDSPAVGAQRQRNFQLPGSRLALRLLITDLTLIDETARYRGRLDPTVTVLSP
jgi:hypothetical protein